MSKRDSATVSFPYWPTPIYLKTKFNVLDINRHLSDIVLGSSTYRSARSLTTIGGYRTNSDLLRNGHPAVQVLTEWIFEAVTALSIAANIKPLRMIRKRGVAEAWGNVYYKGDFQLPHIHHNSIWSGVYYVSVPKIASDAEPSNGGLLELFDPRNVARNTDPFTPLSLQIDPFPGLLVAFPSWLRHEVNPHMSDQPRISIAFNAGISPNE